MAMNIEDLRSALKVYFIMGSPNCYKEPAEVLSEAIAGGITMFQYREKGQGALTGDKKYELAEKLQWICGKNNIPFIVNDDIDLAVAIHADGVHIGQDDEQLEITRERIGDKILGISVHNILEGKKAIQGGADYFGVGPIFPTETKKDTNAVQGVSILESLRSKGFGIPIVGIGGITVENAASVMQSGADGVSVISAISQAEDIRKASSELREKVTGEIFI